MKVVWKDKTGRFKCESCGKPIKEKDLRWDKSMGYCKECSDEIQKYENKISHSPAQQPEWYHQ